jgi:succinyl-CoA:acetate CoA-transferase
MTAEAAVKLFQNGMKIATSGSTMGFPMAPLGLLRSGSRQRGISINGCLEMDLKGQVNSSHVLGAKIMAGTGGTYDYARNSPCSIFIARSTAKGGKISTIVPFVSHVDHTEHDVDVLVTEQGLADLRGLDPRRRVEEIIAKCAHPDYRGLLLDYLSRAAAEPGHIPLGMEEANSFHLRFKRTGSMKE